MVIAVSIPSLLRDCTGGRVNFELEARTLQEALDQLTASYPQLRVHLWSESGQVRKHVLLYYNDTNIAWLNDFDIQLQPGDKLTVFQAVSGG
ncbi:MoaD/ThiS family protein [Paenibacillus sp. GCM10023248]|uniref:MoaD/ThiS family protein n=1 Tax=Bacillales TaxID=1385 RepID=UPI0023795E63|nr:MULTISPECIES: MoaD/ThiS family protein [Bacillales]MDD9267943.1 MoaD/ThiS family protein [Paenibacillus sp. MAHUQ-63]MDR6882376.1 molybdopterin converting factor small subunit [Bacillus sp. 3255]